MDLSTSVGTVAVMQELISKLLRTRLRISRFGVRLLGLRFHNIWWAEMMVLSYCWRQFEISKRRYLFRWCCYSARQSYHLQKLKFSQASTSSSSTVVSTTQHFRPLRDMLEHAMHRERRDLSISGDQDAVRYAAGMSLWRAMSLYLFESFLL